MAFVVPAKSGRFEIRESRNTPKGPRSHTLASFSELTDEVIAKAQTRAAKPPSPSALRRAARRVGAPVARPVAERAARELIAELAKGRRLKPQLKRLLSELLTESPLEGEKATAAEEAAGSIALWAAATPAERGRALVDLLALADALPPSSQRGKPLRFPRLDSGEASKSG